MTSTLTDRPATAPRGGGKSRRRIAAPPLVLFVLIVGLYAAFGSARPAMFDGKLVVFPVLRELSIYTVVGLAQMCALSIGHMNLAVGRMAAFGAMVSGLCYELLGLPLWAGLVAGIVAGGVIGAFTGWLIAKTGVNSFVVTLAMDFFLLGIVSLVYTGLTTGAAFTAKPAGMAELRAYSFSDLCVGEVCGTAAIPQMIVFALVPMAVVGYVYSRTRIGRELLMVGANAKAAELSGVPTKRRVIAAHGMSGALAALAGFLLAVSTGSFKATIGADFMLPSFLGPVLGGTLLAGGAVSVLGTMLGTALTLVIRRGLNLMEVGLEDLNIYIGVVLLAALSADRIRAVIAERKAGRPR